MTRLLLVILICGFAATAFAQRPAPIDKQQLKKELQPLDKLNGVWRGKATYNVGPGQSKTLTQTERVGPMLGGIVKVVEGRGYAADGSTQFNALGVIAYNPATKQLEMRSYADGRVGDFPLVLTDDGFRWTIESGPMKIEYTAVVKDGTWTETGTRAMGNAPPIQFFQMVLKRIGDSDWPQTKPIPMK
ncbi:MAG: DUF1579 family protein [Planctomycetota bacterium]